MARRIPIAQSALASGATGLIIIDMINDLDFDGAEKLHDAAAALVEPILTLRDAADAAGIPVIYVNDNKGEWHLSRDAIVSRVTEGDAPGREIARRLAPRADDYFLAKPQFSGFYATNLPAVLPRLGINRLVLVGIAADICVLFTAADAHMREYDLWVPADGVASEDPEQTRRAVEIMRNSMSADVRPTSETTLADWIATAGR